MTLALDPRVCLECGTTSNGRGVVCRRCGLRFGDEPRRTAKLPTCPICYVTTDDDGLIASPAGDGRRMDLVSHMSAHDRHPVGDDEWLESLRRGDRILIGRWTAPFDVVRHYLVTGVVDAGRSRTVQHNAIVTAMSQIRRWGVDAHVLGDQPEWVEARHAVAALMERYHRRRR